MSVTNIDGSFYRFAARDSSMHVLHLFSVSTKIPLTESMLSGWKANVAGKNNIGICDVHICWITELEFDYYKKAIEKV